jgi:nucleoside-diphosphate-sugar epimerase
MTSTIILTGYNGFMGSHTCAALEKSGFRVVLAGRTPPQRAEVEFIPVDLEAPYSLEALQSVSDVSAIVHLAANIGWPDKTLQELFTANVLSTGLLSDLAVKRSAKLVFASAAIVHGVRAPSIDASVPVNPDTPYGESKLEGERLIIASGCRHAILRFGGIFGRGGPSHLGLNRAIDGALKGQLPSLKGSGEARRNYLYVRDAAEMLLHAVSSEDVSGIHLAAGRETLTISEMLKEVSEAFLSMRQITRSDGDPGSDQVIAVSDRLPRGTDFAGALRDIRESEAE